MPRHLLISLIFVGTLATLPTACGKSEAPGLPGGQAASKIAGEDGKADPPPVEIWQEGRLIHTLRWDELAALPTHSFNTGMDDAQTGYAFVDALKLAGVTEARSVTLYGRGLADPVRLSWKLIANSNNQILLGVTHKNTMKVVANNIELLNRDRWVRHLYKIQIQPGSSPLLSDDPQAGKMSKHSKRQSKGARR
ncbi:MAG: hypothetical protein HY208_00540 [Nitrospirae bacterium]|nr:hypothetical protein [Nitrospirota bacterium]